MIDKLQPRKLDKDTDQKLVQKNSMVDALNVYIDENLSGESGDAGSIKPVLGNTERNYGAETVTDMTSASAQNGTAFDSSYRVLGSCTDQTTNVIYFFVWSEFAGEQGVYAYDPDNVFGEGAGAVVAVIYSELFNFDPQSFIKADVIHKTPRSNSPVVIQQKSDTILYFTDGVNEPRKVDVYHAYANRATIRNRTASNINDYICACPKVPMGNVDFEFESDDEILVNNFESSPGLQFAVQGVYYDGSTTAIGPYSDIAFPPSVVNRGARASVDSLKYNRCKIIVPPLPDEVEFVKILFRQGNKPNFLEIAEVPNIGEATSDPNWKNDGAVRHYNFYNNSVALGVSPSEVSKIFDNVPRKANQQAEASNRLVYGNFVEGYNPTNLGPSIVPVYKARPSEGVDFTVGVVPSIAKVNNSVELGTRRNKASGFEIDTSEIPDEIGAGAVIEFSVGFAPDKNFHVYQADRSYHQSLARGWSFLNVAGYPTSMGGADSDVRTNVNPVEFLPDGSPAKGQETGSGYNRSPYGRANGQFRTEDGVNIHGAAPGLSISPRTRALFGRNFGVSSRSDGGSSTATTQGFSTYHQDGTQSQKPLRWKYWTGTEFKTRVMSFGSSAAAPLIIQGGLVKFKVKFKVIEDVAEGKLVVASFLESYLGGEGNNQPAIIEVDEEGTSIKHTHEVNVNLFNKQQLPVGSPERNLIVACQFSGKESDSDPGNVMDDADNLLPDDEGQWNKRGIPQAHFIFNKGSVVFSMQKSRRDEGDTTRRQLHLRIDDIVPDATDGFYTCVRRPDPGSPWWALSMDQIDNLDSDYDGLQNQLTYSGQVFGGSEFVFTLDRAQSDLQETTYGERSFGRWIFNERDTDDEGVPLVPDGARHFYPCKIDDTNNEFRFSLLDGAAGPGGENPGPDSAFNVYGNSSQGSMTGQVLFTHYGIVDRSNTDTGDIEDLKGNILEDLGRLLPFKRNRRNSIRVGGRLLQFDTNGVGAGNNNFRLVEFGTLGNVVNVSKALATGIPSDKDCKSEIGGAADGLGSEDQFPAVAIFSGPYFTGRINMNPLFSPPEDGNFINIAQATQAENDDADLNVVDSGGWYYDSVGGPSTYQFLNGKSQGDNTLNAIEGGWLPPQTDQTTVLPYVFYTDINDTPKENFPLFPTAYPYPILDNDDRQQVLSDLDAGIITYEQFSTEVEIALNPNPFDAIILPDDVGYHPSHPGFAGISYGNLSPHIEIVSSATNSSTNSSKPLMSFKSSATHEFGIVYFDERGRRGPVNYIGSAYVPGYSSQERQNEEAGPVHIRIDMTGQTPPSWAHHYKVVYSKNTTVSDFFQYSTDGAFAVNSADESDLNATKIYMSLNYLQGNPISYSDAWGAKSQDGSPVVFQPESGDKVRIISYSSIVNGDEEVKRLPNNFVFDVIGVESLDGSESNPLLDATSFQDEEDYFRKQGLFLILRDNPANEGFAIRNIVNDSSFWDNNVVFEIFRPVKEIDEDKRLYFEVGPTFAIDIKDNGTLVHLNENNEEGAIEISQGDVFFRLSALNQKPIVNGQYQSLMTQYVNTPDDGDPNTEDGFLREGEPNFESIFVEASSASDLFKSDSLSIGRPAKIDSNDRERVRPSSLIHSDKDLPKKRKLGYSSFNPSQADDKDLEQNGGAINYMAFTDDSIMVLQDTKVGHIPVDRNIISTADNERSLVASSNVLGTPRYYAGEAGTDHPESVSVIDSAAYFVSSKLGKVFRSSGSNGIMDISAKGMSSFFRNLLTKTPVGTNVMKFFGGHDPKKKEYLLTDKELASYSRNGSSITQGDGVAQTFSESGAQEIVLTLGAFEVPEDLVGSPAFISNVVVDRSQYYSKCCDIDDVLSPVKIGLEALSVDMVSDGSASASFSINNSIRLNLDQIIQNNTEVTVGELNTLMTNSLRAEGVVDTNDDPVVAVLFSPVNGLNPYYAFNVDCVDYDDGTRLVSADQFEAWFVNEFEGPNIFSSLAQGTGFASESFAIEVRDSLSNSERCFLPYTGSDSLLSKWRQYIIKGDDPWESDGSVALPWSTSFDDSGVFPSLLKNVDELKLYLFAGSILNSSEEFDINSSGVIPLLNGLVSVGILDEGSVGSAILAIENGDADLVIDVITALLFGQDEVGEQGSSSGLSSGVNFYDIPFESLFQDDHEEGPEGFVFGDNNSENLVTKILRGEVEYPEDGYALFSLESDVRSAVAALNGQPGPEFLNPICFRANGSVVLSFDEFGGDTETIG